MPKLIEAVYSKGVLKLRDRVDLEENQVVRIRIVESEEVLEEEAIGEDVLARIREAKEAYEEGKAITVQEYIASRGLNV